MTTVAPATGTLTATGTKPGAWQHRHLIDVDVLTWLEI